MTGSLDDAERRRLMELIDNNTNPFWETLRIVPREVHEPGHVSVGLAMRHEVSNRNGVVHGGAIMSLIDAAGGGAARSLTAPDELAPAFPTIDFNVSFLNPARGNVTATGRVVRRGRTLVFVQVEVHDEEGTLVALSRVTYSAIPARK